MRIGCPHNLQDSIFNLHATIQQFSLTFDAKQCFLNCYEIKARRYAIDLRRDPKGDTGAFPYNVQHLLFTEEVLEAKFKIVCGIHKAKLGGNIAYLQFVLSTISRFNLYFAVTSQAAQKLFVIYKRYSIALRFEPFKRMYENSSKIARNSTCSKDSNKRSLP